jgi:hypothetical protein
MTLPLREWLSNGESPEAWARARFCFPVPHNRRSAIRKVAREVVEKAGIKVEDLIKKLVAAAGAEFMTFYYLEAI